MKEMCEKHRLRKAEKIRNFAVNAKEFYRCFCY